MVFEFSESIGSMEIQQQIDACCHTFEQAWKEGESPQMEAFLGCVDKAGHADGIEQVTNEARATNHGA